MSCHPPAILNSVVEGGGNLLRTEVQTNSSERSQRSRTGRLMPTSRLRQLRQSVWWPWEAPSPLAHTLSHNLCQRPPFQEQPCKTCFHRRLRTSKRQDRRIIKVSETANLLGELIGWRRGHVTSWRIKNWIVNSFNGGNYFQSFSFIP